MTQYHLAELGFVLDELKLRDIAQIAGCLDRNCGVIPHPEDPWVINHHVRKLEAPGEDWGKVVAMHVHRVIKQTTLGERGAFFKLVAELRADHRLHECLPRKSRCAQRPQAVWGEDYR